jgi:hypothetical protein
VVQWKFPGTDAMDIEKIYVYQSPCIRMMHLFDCLFYKDYVDIQGIDKVGIDNIEDYLGPLNKY